MQKTGLYALLAILAFALIFAFLPGAGREGTKTDATLQGVELRLFPSRDADAVWSFSAKNVSSNPVSNETLLTGISGGKRVLKERGTDGKLTGRETLDATLDAPDLTIDGQDDMTTVKASIRLVKECAGIVMTGTPQNPVKIEQGYGFTAPIADITSPFLNGHAEKLRMSFQFDLDDMDNDTSSTSLNLDSKETCENGKLVPRAKSKT
ncbi:hypothetical protein [Deinococcus marmoris]|uniref:Uncharacterized protein n=1 Tax=Deinococcus marmoris TaxID=249408 RepID=A0A1U7NWV5_9DEIO|nr:hypothetical protein [Deinococcus marmoris]OLV17387.1 hypothetical protein BOO71_0008896 [Deinococcus marmoris]